MNQSIIYICIIVIVLIIIFKRKSEKFMDNKLKAKILEGIRLNYPEIENINDLEIKEIPDSDKILVKDMIKLYPIKSLFFSHNLDLENYSSEHNFFLIYNSNQIQLFLFTTILSWLNLYYLIINLNQIKFIVLIGVFS